MISYIVLTEQDIRRDVKEFDVDFDITDPNRYDFLSLNSENINQANLIIYIYSDIEVSGELNYKLLKHRYPEDHYKELIDSLLAMKAIEIKRDTEFLNDYLNNLD